MQWPRHMLPVVFADICCLMQPLSTLLAHDCCLVVCYCVHLQRMIQPQAALSWQHIGIASTYDYDQPVRGEYNDKHQIHRLVSCLQFYVAISCTQGFRLHCLHVLVDSRSHALLASTQRQATRHKIAVAVPGEHQIVGSCAVSNADRLNCHNAPPCRKSVAMYVTCIIPKRARFLCPLKLSCTCRGPGTNQQLTDHLEIVFSVKRMTNSANCQSPNIASATADWST